MVSAAGVGALLLTLAACGGTSAPEAQVASIPGASSTAVPDGGGSGASPGSGATFDVDPQLPLGATQAQIDRAYRAYYACWTAHGVPSTHSNGVDGGPQLTWKLNQAKYQADVDACASQEPQAPPELDPQQNPEYWDQLRDELRCMQGKGYPMTVRSGQEGLWVSPETDANFDKVQSDQGVEDSRECETEAFGQG